MEKDPFEWNRFISDFEEKQAHIVGEPLISLMRSKLSEQTPLGHLLEVGCGTGTFTEPLLSGASRITATDISEAMVASAKERFAPFPFVEICREDCYDLSFSQGSFDSLLMANLLHVIPFPEKALQEAKRVLKTGGKLLVLSFTTWGMEEDRKEALNRRYAEAFGKAPKTRKAISPEDLERMVLPFSFQVEESSLLDLDCRGRALFLRASSLPALSDFPKESP